MARHSAITFQYKKGTDGVSRPIIPIELQKKAKSGNDILSVRIEVLVDSGADRCIMWGEIGEALGIDVKSGKEHHFGGIGTQSGKPQVGYEHKVGIVVGGETFNATVIFTYDMPQGLALVGQECFFEYFAIKFDYSNSSVTLRKS